MNTSFAPLQRFCAFVDHVRFNPDLTQYTDRFKRHEQSAQSNQINDNYEMTYHPWGFKPTQCLAEAGKYRDYNKQSGCGGGSDNLRWEKELYVLTCKQPQPRYLSTTSVQPPRAAASNNVTDHTGSSFSRYSSNAPFLSGLASLPIRPSLDVRWPLPITTGDIQTFFSPAASFTAAV